MSIDTNVNGTLVVEASGIALGVNKSKKYIKAVLQSFNKPNRNKRYYPLHKMQEPIKEYIQKVESGEGFGELGHPSDTSPSRLATIDPKYISHIVRECHLEDNLLKATVEPIGPMKDYLIELSEKGRMGFSVRVFAQNWIRNESALTEPDGKILIICYDAVVMPSHYEAYVEKIETVTESYIPEMEGLEISCPNGLCNIEKKKLILNEGLIDAIKNDFKPIKF